MDDLAALHDALASDPTVELAVLFGSRAAGRARPDSDVDLGIVWGVGSSKAERDAVLARVEDALHAVTDPIDLADSPPLLRLEIARSGRVIVERRPWAWADFKALAMLDWWDFAPYARIMHEAARTRLEERRDGPR